MLRHEIPTSGVLSRASHRGVHTKLNARFQVMVNHSGRYLLAGLEHLVLLRERVCGLGGGESIGKVEGG